MASDSTAAHSVTAPQRYPVEVILREAAALGIDLTQVDADADSLTGREIAEAVSMSLCETDAPAHHLLLNYVVIHSDESIKLGSFETSRHPVVGPWVGFSFVDALELALRAGTELLTTPDGPTFESAEAMSEPGGASEAAVRVRVHGRGEDWVVIARYGQVSAGPQCRLNRLWLSALMDLGAALRAAVHPVESRPALMPIQLQHTVH